MLCGGLSKALYFESPSFMQLWHTLNIAKGRLTASRPSPIQTKPKACLGGYFSISSLLRKKLPPESIYQTECSLPTRLREAKTRVPRSRTDAPFSAVKRMFPNPDYVGCRCRSPLCVSHVSVVVANGDRAESGRPDWPWRLRDGSPARQGQSDWSRRRLSITTRLKGHCHAGQLRAVPL